MSDFVMDKALLRDELGSVSTTSGAQFVMTFGQMMMAMWFADSLDYLQLVHTELYTYTLRTQRRLELVISDAPVNDVIIQADIVAVVKRRTQFTLRRPRLFGTKPAQ